MCGLLPDKLSDDPFPPPSTLRSSPKTRPVQSRRRLADIWLTKELESAEGGAPWLLSLASAVGYSTNCCRKSVTDPDAAEAAYADRTEKYKGKCLEAGFDFLPLIFESHGGGFGPAVRTLLARVASLRGARGMW